jgi:CheY-like chemotaxis protein
MPHLDGWGLCEEIRKMGRKCATSSRRQSDRTIVIGMSAAGSNNNDKAAQVGMDGFMDKPFRLDELMGLLTIKSR